MKKKTTRDKGKKKLSRVFQELKVGDRVAVNREISEKISFPGRLQGKTGIVEGRRGKAYIVKIRSYNQEKKYIIAAIHLKKLK